MDLRRSQLEADPAHLTAGSNSRPPRWAEASEIGSLRRRTSGDEATAAMDLAAAPAPTPRASRAQAQRLSVGQVRIACDSAWSADHFRGWGDVVIFAACTGARIGEGVGGGVESHGDRVRCASSPSPPHGQRGRDGRAIGTSSRPQATRAATAASRFRVACDLLPPLFRDAGCTKEINHGREEVSTWLAATALMSTPGWRSNPPVLGGRPAGPDQHVCSPPAQVVPRQLPVRRWRRGHLVWRGRHLRFASRSRSAPSVATPARPLAMVWCMLAAAREGTSPRVLRASDLGEPTLNQCVDAATLERLRRQRWPACGGRAAVAGHVRAGVAWPGAPVRWRRLRSESGPTGPRVVPARRRGGVPPLPGGLLRRRPAGRATPGIRQLGRCGGGAGGPRGSGRSGPAAGRGALHVLSARDVYGAGGPVIRNGSWPPSRPRPSRPWPTGSVGWR